jgi:hypothetical protein
VKCCVVQPATLNSVVYHGQVWTVNTTYARAGGWGVGVGGGVVWCGCGVVWCLKHQAQQLIRVETVDSTYVCTPGGRVDVVWAGLRALV